jgi:hypothetical protein
MLGFLKVFFGDSKHDSGLHDQVAQAVSEGLDIQMAAAAHENWKLRLMSFLDGMSTETFTAESICFDDRCDLGKWIHSTGKSRLGAFPGFTALVGHHKMFHYAASNVVALHKAGKKVEARKMLTGQLETFSRAVDEDLEMMHRIVEQVGSKRPQHG